MSYPIICEVSLKNLISNANSVKSLITPKTKLYAVVKSDAYGHGIIGVSNALYTQVDGFCVSLASEALELRMAGIDKEILLLTPSFKENVESLILKDITLSVCSTAELLNVIDACYRLEKTALIQFKLNTGMNRLGVDTVFEVSKMLSIASKSEVVAVKGAYSHLGAPTDKKYAKMQLENFKRLSDPVKSYDERAILHLSSSGGIILGEDYFFDAIRSGLMLYGYRPNKQSKNVFKPIMKVYAKTLCIRENLKNQRLLYGSRKYDKEAVTLLRLGYADGFFRGGAKHEPSLCMDISAVDGKFHDGYVLVMDNAEVMAKKYNTIPYDILTSCSKRAKIIYV